MLALVGHRDAEEAVLAVPLVGGGAGGEVVGVVGLRTGVGGSGYSVGDDLFDPVAVGVVGGGADLGAAALEVEAILDSISHSIRRDPRPQATPGSSAGSSRWLRGSKERSLPRYSQIEHDPAQSLPRVEAIAS